VAVQHLTSTTWFNYPLGVSETASEAELGRAAARATEMFELKCKTLLNSDPDAYHEDELDKLAAELLRQRKASPGELVRIYTDTEVKRVEEEDQTQYQVDAQTIADAIVPEVDDLMDKIRSKGKLTLYERVSLKARRALTEQATKKPVTMGSLWSAYVKYNGIDRQSREGKRREANWTRWLSVCGQHFITPQSAPEVLRLIHDGLDEYVAMRQPSVTGSSIKRELADILACLRFGSKRYRLGWHIEPPPVRVEEPVGRKVLIPEQQKRLVAACLSAQGEGKRVAVCVLVLMQGGAMVSEIRRLMDDDIRLDARYPFIAIRNKTKKEARKRIVPIVFGLDFLRANINEAVLWVRSVTETTPSAAIKKFLYQVTGDNALTGHCLRHTWKDNAEAADAPDSVLNDIAGWAGRRTITADSLRYGATGIDQSRRVKRLFEWNKKIFKFIAK